MIPVAVALAFAAVPPPVAQLARLAELYHAYHLPVPPADAKLVRHTPGSATRPAPARIGFDATERKSLSNDRWRPLVITFPRALIGCETVGVSKEHTAEIDPDPKAVAPAEVSLPTAIHFHLRGWHELAEGVFAANWLGQNAERLLAVHAVRYWRGQLFTPATDRATVARRLALILQAEPTAFTDDDREFFDFLLLSLTPSKAKPGTIEADIDELLDASAGGFLSCYDPRYFAVIARGFDAVPALIAHLSDARPTRFRTVGGGGFGPGRHYRVKHFASDILLGYMGDDTADLEMKNGVVAVDDAQAWWAKALKVGEETYAVTRVLAADDADSPNTHLLLLLQRKYPERLPEVFHLLLGDRPEMSLDGVADAVANSPLPKETKRTLFAAAAGSKKEGWRTVGEQRLKVLDGN